MNGPERIGPLDCDGVEDLAEEFALGLLDGAARAAVVAHLEGCRQCRARVALLAEAGEQMLLVAPSVEPPPGFEQRVLDRLGPENLRHRRRFLGPRSPSRSRSRIRARTRWALPVVAVASVVVVVLVGAALVLQSGGDDRTDGVAITTAPPDVPAEHVATLLSAHGQRDVGEVVVVDSDPRVVEVDMGEWMERAAGWDDPPPGPWKLAVERADGALELHVLALAEDPRPRVPLEAGGAAVARVSIQDGTGHTWCSAEL